MPASIEFFNKADVCVFTAHYWLIIQPILPCPRPAPSWPGQCSFFPPALDSQLLIRCPLARRRDLGPGPDSADPDRVGLRAELSDFFRVCVPPATDALFRAQWSEAIDAYLGGSTGGNADWPEARRIAESLAGPSGCDGPQRALLAAIAAMQGSDGRAPARWPGYRDLEEK